MRKQKKSLQLQENKVLLKNGFIVTRCSKEPSLLWETQHNSCPWKCCQRRFKGTSLPHLTVWAGISAPLCVLGPVVPEKTHHHLSCSKTREQGNHTSFLPPTNLLLHHQPCTCFGVVPQRRYLGNVGERLLPGARSEKHGVSDPNHFTVPLDSFVALPEGRLVVSLRHRRGQMRSCVLKIRIILDPRASAHRDDQVVDDESNSFYVACES